jgi:hypothetical protein
LLDCVDIAGTIGCHAAGIVCALAPKGDGNGGLIIAVMPGMPLPARVVKLWLEILRTLVVHAIGEENVAGGMDDNTDRALGQSGHHRAVALIVLARCRAPSGS